MSFPRRHDDRRRRVLMSSASATAGNPTPGTRARMEALREARRPALVYGTRVRHCLRGRWFSLVPVQRKSLAKVFASILLVVVSLVVANDATKRFPAIADRPQFVDVFQIARHGSVGRYFVGVMYLALAGTAWLVYQLRRFRNDDFSGNYRVWQWIVGLSLASSVACLVPILGMLGGTVEWALGKRIALSGEDWIGLFLIVGGAILAMRSVAEMWRYRSCVSLLLSGWVCMAIPIAVDWNMLSTQTNLRWTIATSAPLLAVSFWFAATLSYLRVLYCEVRGIAPSAGWLERFRAAARQRQTERAMQTAQSRVKEERATSAPISGKSASPKATTPDTQTGEPSGRRTPVAAATEPDANKRRWFGIRGPAKASVRGDASTAQATTPSRVSEGEEAPDEELLDEQQSGENPQPQRQRWWSRRQPLKSQADSDAQESVDARGDAEDDTEDDAQIGVDNHADSDGPAAKKRRFGLGAMMKRKTANANQDASVERETQPTPTRDVARGASRQVDEVDDEDGDDDDSMMTGDDDVDWSSMNKAERRKMRKQLKRSGRAA